MPMRISFNTTPAIRCRLSKLVSEARMEAGVEAEWVVSP
jgi:hypothetical protein